MCFRLHYLSILPNLPLLRKGSLEEKNHVHGSLYTEKAQLPSYNKSLLQRSQPQTLIPLKKPQNAAFFRIMCPQF
jgi:hypothetical protein